MDDVGLLIAGKLVGFGVGFKVGLDVGLDDRLLLGELVYRY